MLSTQRSKFKKSKRKCKKELMIERKGKGAVHHVIAIRATNVTTQLLAFTQRSHRLFTIKQTITKFWRKWREREKRKIKEKDDRSKDTRRERGKRKEERQTHKKRLKGQCTQKVEHAKKRKKKITRLSTTEKKNKERQ